MGCKKCNSSLTKSKSIIGSPLCNTTCPEDTVCVDIIPSNCVYYSGPNLDCSEIVFGESITTSIQKLNDLVCSNTDSCNTWTALTKANLGIASGWSVAANGTQSPAISDVKNCIVRLAGSYKRSSFSTQGQVLLGTLPVGKRPSATRVFSVNISTTSAYPLNLIPSILSISTTGEMYVTNPYNGVVLNPVVSLDGISFEIGTL